MAKYYYLDKNRRLNFGLTTQVRPKDLGIDIQAPLMNMQSIYSLITKGPVQFNNARLGQSGAGMRPSYSGLKQKGKGLSDIFSALKNAAQKVSNAYASPQANKLKNTWGKMVNKNPNWRSGYAGEKHLMTPSGTTYNFAGPSTRLKERLLRGDKGINQLDSCAKQHDISYSRSRNMKDVRISDKRFIDCLDSRVANSVTKRVVKGLMHAKMAGEDTGLFQANTFTDMPFTQGKGYAIKRKKKKDPSRKLKRKLKRASKRKKNIDKMMNIAVASLRKRLR